MHPILLYLLKMIGYSGVLVLYYYLFLRDRQFHQYNRYYLLSALVLSILLPLINIPVFWNGNPSEAPLYVQTMKLTTISSVQSEPAHAGLSGNLLLMIAYLVVSATLLLMVFRSVKKILLLRRKYAPIKLHNINFYETEEKEAPFSFFRNIFWDKKLRLDSDRGRQVFRHELHHSRQLHAADLIFMQLVLSLAWFNPFFYFIKRELTTIHEYLADQFAISENDRHDYAEFIVRSALHQFPRNPVTHYFFHSSLKRRIAMILKNSTNRRLSYLERIMIIPLVAGLFFVFAFRAQIVAQEPARSAIVQNENKSSTTAEPVNTDRKSVPANDTMISRPEKQMIRTLRYPKDPLKKGVVSPAGEQARKHAGHSLHQQDTIPPNQAEVIAPAGKKEPAGGSSKIFIRNKPTDEPPLYIVNGVEKTSPEGIKGEIKNVHVWKGSEAVKRFGEKGKNGVIVVTTTPNINTKRVEITFDKNTGYAELAAMKSYCEQRGITLNIRETKYNDQEELVYVSFEVDCGDGFKGAASAGTVALASEHVRFGFYRDYSPKALSPFGTGSF